MNPFPSFRARCANPDPEQPINQHLDPGSAELAIEAGQRPDPGPSPE
jgi:hypothetical protein